MKSLKICGIASEINIWEIPQTLNVHQKATVMDMLLRIIIAIKVVWCIQELKNHSQYANSLKEKKILNT